MTVSSHGVLGRASLPQVNAGSITTLFQANGALSRPSFERSASGAPMRYPNSESFQRSGPAIAFAYGSWSSLAGLKRWPSCGAYFPWTRYP